MYYLSVLSLCHESHDIIVWRPECLSVFVTFYLHSIQPCHRATFQTYWHQISLCQRGHLPEVCSCFLHKRWPKPHRYVYKEPGFCQVPQVPRRTRIRVLRVRVNIDTINRGIYLSFITGSPSLLLCLCAYPLLSMGECWTREVQPAFMACALRPHCVMAPLEGSQ